MADLPGSLLCPYQAMKRGYKATDLMFPTTTDQVLCDGSSKDHLLYPLNSTDAAAVNIRWVRSISICPVLFSSRLISFPASLTGARPVETVISAKMTFWPLCFPQAVWYRPTQFYCLPSKDRSYRYVRDRLPTIRPDPGCIHVRSTTNKLGAKHY